MVWLKECPRCQGDLLLDRDCYGTFKTCVQCGYMKDLLEPDTEAVPLASSATGTDPDSFKTFLAMLSAD